MKNIKNRIVMFAIIFTMALGGTNLAMPQVVVHADATVYVTRTGSCYHAYKCGRGTYYASTLSSAKARGLRACMKCYPYGEPSGVAEGTSNVTTNYASVSTPAVKKISLSKKSIVLIKGQSKTLKVKHATGDKKWKSSNKKVAKVSKKGKVTAKKTGKATITVTANGQQKKCKVKVEDPTLNKQSVEMQEDDECVLKLNGCSHKDDIKWWSTNDAVADVGEYGEVETYQAGTATIKAKVHGKTFKCKVTVKAVEEDDIDDEVDEEDEY